jgi:hypothetical protein
MTTTEDVKTSDSVGAVGKPNMVMRSLRVPLPLWEKAKDKCEAEDLNISDVVRELLAEWVAGR